MRHHSLPSLLLFCLIIPGLLLGISGCGKTETIKGPPDFSSPEVLVPTAPGETVSGNEPIALDLSNVSQGYLTADNHSPDKRINLQLTDPGGIPYSYFLDPSETAVISFSSGSGSYALVCYQQVHGEQYAAIYSQTLEVELDNEFLPFLYPNQYVDFTPDSKACLMALSLAPADASETTVLEAIYNYVIDNVTYDTEKAETVDVGYLPDVDETLNTRTGICFDYAALMTAMLRSRDIPCKLQIGYAGDVKHAWIDVYLRGHGWVNKIIEFDGNSWSRMDPTFASTADTSDNIDSYIGDGTNYSVQFTR